MVLRNLRRSLVTSVFLAALLGGPFVPAVSPGADAAPSAVMPATSGRLPETAPVPASAPVSAPSYVSGASTAGPLVAAILAVLVLLLVPGPVLRSRIARLTSTVAGAAAGPRAPPAAA